MVVEKITNGIKISVATSYEPAHSNPLQNVFWFSYRITIHNMGAEPVQLLRRHWYIFDSNGVRKEVEGEGVIGEQPVIRPGKSHQYVSGCNLKTEIGSMHGTYLMRNLNSEEDFEVLIPEFFMIVPSKLN